MKKTRKVSLPTLRRAAKIQPETLDREKRTVDVIFTKGARILRRDFWDGDFYEELGLEKSEVRMERLESGNAPVMDNHGFTDKAGVRATIGVVQSAKLISGKEGRATLRYSKRAEVEDIFTDIEDGILRNISVGYNTHKFEKVGEENNLPIFRATDWSPIEISNVPAGADMEAVVRAAQETMTECVIVEETRGNDSDAKPDSEPESSDSKPDSEPESSDSKPDSEPESLDAEKRAAEKNNNELEKQNQMRNNKSNGGNDMTKEEIEKLQKEAREQGIADENKRQVEIRAIVKKVSLSEELAETYINDEKTIDDVRTLVIDALAKKDGEPGNQTRSTNVELGDDNSRIARVKGMTSALLHRFRPKALDTRNESGQKMTLPGYELCDEGRAFAYLSLVDMARACLEGNNVRTGMHPKHILADMALNNVRSLHSTSDFPEILANVTNKTLRDGYLAAPKTWMPFTNEVSVSDFKEISRTNLGDAPELLKLQEGSEVKRGTMSEAAEKYVVEEYARIIALSRKTIINDDLQAFTRIPERMGRRASDLESDLVWAIFKANAALADTFALFSSQHGNLSTVPAAPSETGLNEMRAAMRRQVGLDGAQISIIPVWAFVPPAHETAMEKLLATTRPNNASDVNPFGPSGRTTLDFDVEPRLETGSGGSLTAWFGTADKGQVDMVELARLEGTNGPQVQTRDGFDVNGVEIKIMHDVGVKAIDFRGLFKNAGA